MAENPNVEAVRGVYERWRVGDFSSGVEPYDADSELVLRSPLPDAGTYIGPSEIRSYMRGLLSAWDALTIVPEDIQGFGDSVVVRVLQRGTGTASGVETEARYFMVWTFRGPTAVRIQSIQDEADALTAAGVEGDG